MGGHKEELEIEQKGDVIRQKTRWNLEKTKAKKSKS